MPHCNSNVTMRAKKQGKQGKTRKERKEEKENYLYMRNKRKLFTYNILAALRYCFFLSFVNWRKKGGTKEGSKREERKEAREKEGRK